MMKWIPGTIGKHNEIPERLCHQVFRRGKIAWMFSLGKFGKSICADKAALHFIQMFPSEMQEGALYDEGMRMVASAHCLQSHAAVNYAGLPCRSTNILRMPFDCRSLRQLSSHPK